MVYLVSQPLKETKLLWLIWLWLKLVHRLLYLRNWNIFSELGMFPISNISWSMDNNSLHFMIAEIPTNCICFLVNTVREDNSWNTDWRPCYAHFLKWIMVLDNEVQTLKELVPNIWFAFGKPNTRMKLGESRPSFWVFKSDVFTRFRMMFSESSLLLITRVIFLQDSFCRW